MTKSIISADSERALFFDANLAIELENPGSTVHTILPRYSKVIASWSAKQLVSVGHAIANRRIKIPGLSRVSSNGESGNEYHVCALSLFDGRAGQP